MDFSFEPETVFYRLMMIIFIALTTPLCADEGVVKYRLSDADAAEETVREMLTDRALDNSLTDTEKPAPDDSQSKKSGRYCLPGDERAGGPHCIARWARLALKTDYEVGFIGGGTVLFGDRRCRHEGTFGLDYAGCLLHRKTWLKWTHGGRYQGGAGAYASDGPKFHE